MKHFLWTIALLLAGSPCAYPQNVTQTVAIGVDVGEGDNVVSTLVGPGVNVVAGGYTASQMPDGFGGLQQCYWCNNSYVAPPGSSLNVNLQLVFSDVYGSLTVGGQTYCQNGCPVEFPGQGLFVTQNPYAQSITLPTSATDGQTFTYTMPAVVAGPFIVTLDNGQNFQLEPNPANGELTLSFVAFDFPNPYEGYVFSGGMFTTAVSAPEPGPLGLMAAGLVGILGLRLKHRVPTAARQRGGYPARRFA